MRCEACERDISGDDEVFEVARWALYCRWCCVPARPFVVDQHSYLAVGNEAGPPLLIEMA